MTFPSDRYVLCHKAPWVRGLNHLIFAVGVGPLDLHGGSLGLATQPVQECLQVRQEVATQWAAEAEGMQGSTTLRWLTPKHRTFAHINPTAEACRTCHIKGDSKVPIQAPQVFQHAVPQ